MKKIAVIGSINRDLVVEANAFPKKGETIKGNSFAMFPGGKGANQAVAISRLGGNVSFFGSLGDDENGRWLMQHLENELVETVAMNVVKDVPTGVALIELSEQDNRIIIVPGANDYTDVSYIKPLLEELLRCDLIVFQMEIPIELITYLVPILAEQQKTTILNPAPAVPLSPELMEKVTYIIPNEHEYQIVFQTNETISEILKRYPNQLIITEGEKGVSYFDGSHILTIPSISVSPVDTTGAGDTFIGAFAVGIAEGKSLEESLRLATIASGLSVTKKGAQSGIPKREEVERFQVLQGDGNQ